MKNVLFYLAVIMTITSLSVRSESIKTSHNTLGETVTFASADNNQSLNVNLWLPETTDKQLLPLLVVLDGQRYFNYAVSMHHMLQDYGWTPPFAVLGIDTSKDRWPMLSNQRQAILGKLENQVIPHIKSKYSLSDERILFGWEAAGGLPLILWSTNQNYSVGTLPLVRLPCMGSIFLCYSRVSRV